jgi:hypothetical protein
MADVYRIFGEGALFSLHGGLASMDFAEFEGRGLPIGVARLDQAFPPFSG